VRKDHQKNAISAGGKTSKSVSMLGLAKRILQNPKTEGRDPKEGRRPKFEL
jgi:hypothetical protein